MPAMATNQAGPEFGLANQSSQMSKNLKINFSKTDGFCLAESFRLNSTILPQV